MTNQERRERRREAALEGGRRPARRRPTRPSPPQRPSRPPARCRTRDGSSSRRDARALGIRRASDRRHLADALHGAIGPATDARANRLDRRPGSSALDAASTDAGRARRR